ncbi:MAG TPA: MarR family transcriptional regulator, partial [Methyloceanibacter sp.]|nr:MarR family transcriptional regulator [Methyloceanibacter sp.]
ILADFDFGRAHHRVLHFVNRHSGLRVADLLDVLNITKQSLSRVLKQLIDKGYVVQRAGSSDRRERQLFPTDKGRALAERLAAPQSVRLAAALQAAGPGAEALVRRFLEAMVNAEERPKVSSIMASSPVPLKEGGKGGGG